jgi:arylsulfatase A-like enzyme
MKARHIRVVVWFLGLLVLGNLVPNLLAANPPAKPNILLIVADDLGWQDVGWHKSKFLTPVMDRLVKEGVELDRHYVQPVCSPTRTALLSGRWTSRFGPHVLSPTNLRAYPPGTTTLASALKEAGYSTYLSGKWHLGSKPQWGPNNYGFDHSYGSLTGAADPWTHKYRAGEYENTWHRDGKFLDEEGNATELIAAEAVKFIKEKRSPWFVYVPFQAVHIPVDAPAEYKKKYEGVKFDENPAKQDSLLRFGAFVNQLDTKVGQLIATLEATGQRTNTIVIFTSDNGGLASGGNPYVGDVAGSPALSSNFPLRGFKNQLYEGGVRVSAFVNWPGVLAPGKNESFIHAADWFPTLTSLAGWKAPQDLKLDGLNVWPQLAGPTKQAPRTIYIPHPAGSILIHDGWKLIDFKATKTKPKAWKELYHVTEDPTEAKDLAAEKPDKVTELFALLETLRKDDRKDLPADLKGEHP